MNAIDKAVMAVEASKARECGPVAMNMGLAVSPLKSCPFCGALEDDLQLLDLGDVMAEGHAVTCSCCGAIGPSDYRPAAARALWNGAALVPGVSEADPLRVAA